MKEYSQCWAMLMERGWGRLGARGFEMSGKGDLSGSIGCSSVVAILFAKAGPRPPSYQVPYLGKVGKVGRSLYAAPT